METTFIIDENGNVYKHIITDNAVIDIHVGLQQFNEEIKDEEGNVINTIAKRFNLETGEYEVIGG